MKSAFIVAAFTFSIAGAIMNKKQINTTYFWVQQGDSVHKIDTYNEGNCLPHPNTYCSYWTTTNFPFNSMSDTLFQALKSNGYFIGHDFNYRYLE